MTPRHGVWGALGTLVTGTAAAAAPNGDLITAALITLAGGVLLAFIGPIATVFARNLVNRSKYRQEQQTLNDLLIEEMAGLRRDNESLRTDNESLREENTRLRRRGR